MKRKHLWKLYVSEKENDGDLVAKLLYANRIQLLLYVFV